MTKDELLELSSKRTELLSSYSTFVDIIEAISNTRDVLLTKEQIYKIIGRELDI